MWTLKFVMWDGLDTIRPLRTPESFLDAAWAKIGDGPRPETFSTRREALELTLVIPEVQYPFHPRPYYYPIFVPVLVMIPQEFLVDPPGRARRRREMLSRENRISRTGKPRDMNDHQSWGRPTRYNKSRESDPVYVPPTYPPTYRTPEARAKLKAWHIKLLSD
jgi:hypothetical protein